MAIDGGNAGLVYSDGEPVTTEYAWLGAPDQSASAERVNGNETRRNTNTDPRFTTGSKWYQNPSATYSFGSSSGVSVSVKTAFALGALLTYTAAAIPAGPGESVGARYTVTNTGTEPLGVYGNIRGYSAAGAATVDGATSAVVTIAPGASDEVVLATTAMPANTTGYRALLRTRPVNVGQTMRVSRAMTATLDAGSSIGMYFDGASINRSTYQATLDGGQAASTYTNIVLEPKLDRAPVERVEVTIKEILPSATYIDLYRLVEGRTMLVRGGVKVYAVGGLTVVDFEAPFGVQMTYRAEMFADQAGTLSLGFTGSADTVLDVATTCVHQPLDPQLAVWPTRLQGTASEITRRNPGELVYTEGATVGTWVGTQRRGVEGVVFDLMTDTRAEADTFQSMLGGYTESNVAVLCIRTPPPMRLPRVFFGTVAELVEVDVDVHSGGESVRFQFTSDEALPPAPGLVTAILTRDDIDAAYPTREARAAAYLTRLDRDRDYSLAGLAG